MKLRKRQFIILLIIVLAILAYVGYFITERNKDGYKKINIETNNKIMSVIKKSKGGIPNLQTDNAKARWTAEAHVKQSEIMGKVLDTLSVVGEARKGKPDKHVIATLNDNMQIYIPYNKENPHEKIIIEFEGHYYLAVANVEDISMVIEYMRKAAMLRD